MEKTQLVDSKKEPNKILIMVVVAASNLCAWCCISLIAPFFSLEAAKKGVNDSVIGAIFSSSELVMFLVSPVCAKLMSSSSPRFFYITGLIVFGCCNVMFGILDRSPPGTPFIALCFAVRIVGAVGTACVMTSSYAIAGNTFPEKTATVYGILQTVSGAGFFIGPAAGGGLYQIGGYKLPFWVFGVIVVICGCASCMVLPRHEYVAEQIQHSSLSLFRSPLVWLGTSTILIAVCGITFYTPVFAEHLLQFDLSENTISWIYVLFAASYSLTTPLWGMLLDKNLPPIPFIIGGLVSACINMLLFGPAPFLTFIPTTLWLIIVTSLFVGICSAPAIAGGMRCIVFGLKSLGLPYDTTTFGLVGGIFQSSICLGTFGGPLLGGIFTEWYGYGWAMTINAFIYCLPVVTVCPFLSTVACRSVKSEDSRADNSHILSETPRPTGRVLNEQETYH